MNPSEQVTVMSSSYGSGSRYGIGNIPPEGGMLTNTEYERLAFSGEINLSDGHARLPLDSTQLSIVRDLGRLFQTLAGVDQNLLERTFLDRFFSLLSQSTALSSGNIFLSYSSSCELKLIAQACRIKNLRVCLIDPVFDNIRHFLETERISLTGFHERLLEAPRDLPAVSENVVLWLVLPNNPTGFTLTADQFNELLLECRRRNWCIVLDASFRPNSSSMLKWDMYAQLASSEVEFVIVEDTGKAWSLLDVKVGISVASDFFARDLHILHDQLLLNVSPLHLTILIKFLEDAAQRGLRATIWDAVERNRREVRSLIDQSCLRSVGDCSQVPMELVGLPDEIDARTFWCLSRKVGVDILPAQNYYWQSNEGERYFRMPLARPHTEIVAACERLLAVSSKI
jgi:aspartate/methionine/tyrosine aminotransferase